MTRIAVFGTGIMGAPIACNLAAAGHDVVVWNRSFDKAEALAGPGITPVRNARDAARGADAAILMVSTGAVCDTLLFGDDGIAEALPRGSAVVVMSSIPVETARAEAARLADLGIDYVDAPVSGGERGAVAGTLTIMAGGAADAVVKAAEWLAPVGRVTHVGPVGSGQLAKLANQLIVGVTIGAVAEALLLVDAGGGDAEAVHRALQGGFADSTIWRQHGERMIRGDFQPGAHATVQLKDLDTSTGLAGSLGLELPFAGLARDLYARMCEGPRATLDHSALYLELAERRNG